MYSIIYIIKYIFLTFILTFISCLLIVLKCSNEIVTIFKILILPMYVFPFDLLLFFIKRFRYGKEDCPICRDSLENDILILYNCKHCFHRKCFYKWDSVCPICRRQTLKVEREKLILFLF